MNTTTNDLEAAKLAWAEHPTAANERAFYDAKKAADFAEAKATLAARKEAEQSERNRVKAYEAKRKRLTEVLAITRGLPAAIAGDVEWFTKVHVEAFARVEAMHKAVNRQREAVREATQLAAELGVTVEIEAEAHERNCRGMIGRAQGRALTAKGLGRESVADYFLPAFE